MFQHVTATWLALMAVVCVTPLMVSVCVKQMSKVNAVIAANTASSVLSRKTLLDVKVTKNSV